MNPQVKQEDSNPFTTLHLRTELMLLNEPDKL